MARFEENKQLLKDAAYRLQGLMQAEESGLFTWYQCVNSQVEAIVLAYYGEEKLKKLLDDN